LSSDNRTQAAIQNQRATRKRQRQQLGTRNEKALARLQELRPGIEELRGQGFGVTITLIVEVPNQIDIAAVWAGIGVVESLDLHRRVNISNAGFQMWNTTAGQEYVRTDEAEGSEKTFRRTPISSTTCLATGIGSTPDSRTPVSRR
jgi:hypothetical protein